MDTQSLLVGAQSTLCSQRLIMVSPSNRTRVVPEVNWGVRSDRIPASNTPTEEGGGGGGLSTTRTRMQGMAGGSVTLEHPCPAGLCPLIVCPWVRAAARRGNSSMLSNALVFFNKNARQIHSP